jgi:hypothetical protein
MSDFNPRKRKDGSHPLKKHNYSTLPWLYAGELVNSILKTHYHNRSGHFQDKFCWKTYFGFTALHKICFHPLRIVLDDFSNHILCSGVVEVGFWRQLLTGMVFPNLGFIPAAFSSMTLQFFDELKHARAFSIPTPRTLTIMKDCQIGLLYGLSWAS